MRRRGGGGAAAGKSAPQPAQPQVRPAPREKRRAVGGVPPAEAFEGLPRRAAPNLPGRPAPEPRAQAGGGEPARKAGVAIPLPGAAEGAHGEPRGKAGAPRRTAHPRRRRLRRRVTAALVIAALIGGGVWLSVSMLFKIGDFELTGESPYTLEEITAAFGRSPGEAMFGFSAGAAEQRIESMLPYIEDVRVSRRLPSTVCFEVSPAVEAYWIEWEGGAAVLSASLKVLSVGGAAPEGLTRIGGLSQLSVAEGEELALTPEAARAASGAPASSSVGADASDTSAAGGSDVPEAQAAYGAAECFETLKLLLAELEQAGLSEIDRVEVGDPLNIEFSWQGRVTVRLGATARLGEKMRVVRTLLADDGGEGLIGPRDRGVLDMKLYFSIGQAIFSPA